MDKLEIQRILRKIRVRPNKKKGQNFVLDEELLELMPKEARITNEDEVVEIGGGMGFLSEKILEFNPKKLFIYEPDRRLFNFLLSKLKGKQNVVLMNEDYLKSQTPRYQVNISNPPFSISSKIFLKVLQERPRIAILTFQKEFANRLVAKPGTQDYGKLSIISYFFAEVRIIKTVDRLSFFPSPKVDIALVKIIPKEETTVKSNFHALEGTLKELFKYRQKLLKKAIRFSNIKNKEEVVKKFQEIMEKRVFQLTPEELLDISRVVKF
ncbi:MAG: 16S rRNA (adenine(1518)-N(6)/adenine(1519)-N(6))-dimethyltransferase RsmA [Thermoproteota archaeon]|nr:ribosomal RNA small subunit methyltransferase A [Candidatus Brockarchaeota archaeon]MBO3801679.1 ribosomal RNA small subunit methyltransferase A [Candidatus Brockarchaeota archaeon]